MISKNKIFILFVLLFVAFASFVVFQYKTHPKVGYVNIKEIYEGFEMKKQMEQKYLKIKKSREKILDSLKFELNTLLKQIDSEKQKNPLTIREFELKRDLFLQKKTSFEEENNALTAEYDQGILTQLNQYIKDYGIQNNFSLLFGSDGNGSLMYGTEELNKTKEVLEYVNSKYNGVE